MGAVYFYHTQDIQFILGRMEQGQFVRRIVDKGQQLRNFLRAPPIPEQIQRISLHDDGKYYVKMDPRPDGYPIFCSAVKNGDGTYEAIAQLITVHGKILDTQSFHLEPKSETNALLGESYAYTIGSIGVGWVYELRN